MRSRRLQLSVVCIYSFLFLTGFIGLSVHPPTVEPAVEELLSEEAMIYRIEPEERGGEAFKLIYLVPVPIDVFWRFKTDFRGDFLQTNKYIHKHRLINLVGHVAVTEDTYSNDLNHVFRWKTTMHPDEYRLDFRLDNPEECGQSFHYGTIQLEPFHSYTKVTHIAYFDFFGASLWVNFPLEGGMSSFLVYTARWEKETISRLEYKYTHQFTR